MKPRIWGVIAFLLTVAVAATPAHSSESYVASASQTGIATYMGLNPDGTFSEPQILMQPADHDLTGFSFGNGIGDFNNDGQLDYIVGLGRYGGDIYVFPKTGPGPQFDPPVWAGSWTVGVLPADIAVADFNGDGNMDFVMNYYYSPHCGLYLGDGDFGFSYTLLENTTSYRAMGIDAADFNNDEIADFVVAPNDPGPLYVHLGNPDGTFTKLIVERTGSTSIAHGIAAGNFIEDGDGFADLAVSAGGQLEIYRGNGDGTFVLEYSWDLDVNTSPLDNGDFNRDGHQDVMVGDYGADHDGVAILLGDGQGQFEWDYTYSAANAGYRKAVTALPYVPNLPPVAHVTPDVIKVTVGETVKWDASGSYDEDGTIVSFEWDYGDGAVEPMAAMAMADSGDNLGEPQSSYVYYDSGTYFVTVKVTDDQGASTTVQAEVQVEPMPVSVRYSPRKFEVKSKGKWITATIRLPDGYHVGMVVADSLYLVPEGMAGIKAHKVYGLGQYNKYYKKYKHYEKKYMDSNRPKHYKKSMYYKKKYMRAKKLKVKFSRQALIEKLNGATGDIALTVVGDLATDGGYLEFAGTETVKAYEKKRKRFSKKEFWHYIWRLFSKHR